jgi:ribosomal-protein-serine acetyltransferase
MVTLLPTWPPSIPLEGTVELRRWRVADADALSAAVEANLDHLRPWMSWIADEPAPRQVRTQLLAEWEAAAATDRHYGIFDAEIAVGSIAAMSRIGPGALEIGYWLDHRYTGRGLVTMATRALLDLAFDTPAVSRVEIQHDKANIASGAVPARLGFVHRRNVAREVGAPGECGVTSIWEMTRTRWRFGPIEAAPAP